MKRRTFLGLAMSLALPQRGIASAIPHDGRPLGVVELFTSQGCNSCPKADAVFAELASRGDVVALSYHVDYWDYLGWRDTLASPANTQRQSDYARMLGLRSVYTPQAVVNGRKHFNGARQAKIAAALSVMSSLGRGMTVDVGIEDGGSSILIRAGASTGQAAKAHVSLAFVHPSRTVEITRGENAGKTFTYFNAVAGMQAAGMWHGKAAEYEIPATELEKHGAAGCAVLVQSVDPTGGPGPILGAAMMRRPSS